MRSDQFNNVTKNGYAEYLFYFYGTQSEEPEDLERLFNDGISSWFNSIGSILNKVDSRKIKREGIDKLLLKFMSDNPEYNTVCIVKIPVDYMALVQHGDGKLNSPIPLFKDNGLQMYGVKEYLFTPHLVHGAYSYTTGNYIENPNFCPVFDAKGLKYSSEQIENINFFNKADWSLFASTRSDYSFEKLYSEDEKFPTLDNAMKDYCDKFHTSIKEAKYNSGEYIRQYMRLKDKR